MRLRIKQVKWKTVSLLQIYLLSMTAVMFFLVWKKSDLLLQTSLFNKDTLEAMKGHLISGNALLLPVLKERIVVIASLFLLATTYLGGMYVHMNVVWYGACSGLFLTVVLLRYGLKGILLLFAGLFPHYLIYIPALVLTLRLCKEKRTVNQKYCMQMIIILLVVITGCLLECYVNPKVVTKLLKKF